MMPCRIGYAQGMAFTTTRAEPSLGELVSQATREMSTILRKEVELAKAEIAAELPKPVKGIGMFGGAGVVALYGLGFAALAAVYGLGEVMPLGWAALIVAGFFLLTAATLALVGKRAMASFDPKPERTIRTLKEDVEWARHPTS